MSRGFIVRPLAEADLEDAAGWYEDERAGLAERFFSDVDRTFARASASDHSSSHRGGRSSPSTAAHFPVRGLLSGVRRDDRRARGAAPEEKSEVTAVVASSIMASVNAWVTMTPDRLTPRWSFFQPRLPCPPCFAAAHSPSPRIESPVLSTMRWTRLPVKTRSSLRSRC
jgi:plasmid stabilization system protein ParE